MGTPVRFLTGYRGVVRESTWSMGRLIQKELNGIEIFGFSLAGEETVVSVPEYNVCFDIGRAPREVISIDNICLSHGHMDHAAGIAYYFSQRSFVGIDTGRVIVHRNLAPAIEKLLEVWAEIEGHPSPANVQGVESLQDVVIRRGLLVRPFAVNHAGYALGFTLIEVRHKLKSEFLGKSGPQLVALKQEGIEIERRVEMPLLTFTGDTAIGRFLDHDFVRRSPAVLLECTFYEQEHVTRARAGRHIHAQEIPKILEAIPDAQIMLTHVTRRTDLRLAKRILQGIISSNDQARVSFLMERPPRNNRHRPPQRTVRTTDPTAHSQPADRAG